MVAIFIVTLDVLKYGFGIDPAREDLERLRKKKVKPRIIFRFIYVHSTANPYLTSGEEVSVV